ncbi:MAG: sensor histidine kinase [Candidatus Melainabacteria bacterium]|nr:sensor histidine kinase [Candidatus Melainabacteria bacterium]
MRKSIRRKLLLWLSAGLGVIWIISALIGYFLALKFSDDSFDRELINSSDSVAARIKFKEGRLVVDLPPAAQAILRHNNRDMFFYQVLNADGERLSGDKLPLPDIAGLSDVPSFRLIRLPSARGDKVHEVRLAELKVLSPENDGKAFIIQVGETLAARKQLSYKILASIMLPQFVTALLGAYAVWIGISRGLAPLRTMQEAISARSASDLSDVDDSISPEETYPLVQSINELLARLRAYIEAQKRFIANASHQLRTPLAGLKTYSSLGLGAESAVEMKEVIGQIDFGLERLTRLVNQLLSLARVDPYGATALKPEVFDVADVLSEVLTEQAALAAAKSIDFGLEDECVSYSILGDRIGLQQLFSNLVDNALQYTPAYGRVTVSLKTFDDRLFFAVRDTGPGIPDIEKEKIFERFYRLSGAGTSGSGLGLSIVKEVASTFQAQVSIETGENGIGTVFTVSFPAGRRD